MAKKVIIFDTTLKEIADAIRAKNGETTQYLPSEMAKAILAISTSTGGGGSTEPVSAIKTIYKRIVKTGADGTAENWDATEDFEFVVPDGITKVKLNSNAASTTIEFIDGNWDNPADIVVSSKGTVISVQAGKTYRFNYYTEASQANQNVTFEFTCGGSIENETALSTKVPTFA